MSNHRVYLVAALALAACGDDPELPAGLDRWLADWEAARACLAPTVRGDLTATLAMQALDGTRPDCTVQLAAVQIRSPRGRDALTVTWRDAIAAAGSIDQHDEPAQTGETIAHVDRQTDLLRFAVALPAVKRAHKRGPARLDRGVTLAVAGAELAADTPLVLRAGTIAGRAGTVDFIATSLATVRTIAHAADQVAAVPTGTLVDGPALAAVEARGTKIVLRADPAGAYAVEHTTTTGTRRTVIDRGAGELVAVWQAPLSGAIVALRHDPRPGGGLHVDSYDPGNPHWRGADLELGPGSPWATGARIECHNDQLAWATAGDRLYLVGRTTSAEIALASARAKERTFDCRNVLALVLSRAPDRLARCEEDGCTQVHEPAHGRRGVAALDANGGWYYAVELAGVVGVWRDHMQPRFFRLAAPAKLVGIVVLEGTPHVVTVEADRRYRFVALPPETI